MAVVVELLVLLVLVVALVVDTVAALCVLLPLVLNRVDSGSLAFVLT